MTNRWKTLEAERLAERTRLPWNTCCTVRSETDLNRQAKHGTHALLEIHAHVSGEDHEDVGINQQNSSTPY